MNLTIPLTILKHKAERFPSGFLASCMASGKVEGQSLVISVADYDKAKQRPQKPMTVVKQAKVTKCCGGKPK